MLVIPMLGMLRQEAFAFEGILSYRVNSRLLWLHSKTVSKREEERKGKQGKGENRREEKKEGEKSNNLSCSDSVTELSWVPWTQLAQLILARPTSEAPSS
jgi:hypothetical protein